MESEHESWNAGWIFIVLLLFFGIFGGGFGCSGGLFNRGGCCHDNHHSHNANDLAELVALKSITGNRTMNDNCTTDRDVLDLKTALSAQSAIASQQLDTAFRTLLCEQNNGFATLRTQMLQDQLHDRDMTLMAKNSEISTLKTQIHNDNRFNSIEQQLAAIECHSLKRPPFYPMGCSPCVTNCCPPANG